MNEEAQTELVQHWDTCAFAGVGADADATNDVEDSVENQRPTV